MAREESKSSHETLRQHLAREKLLGKGAFGEVWLVHHVQTRICYAQKEMNLDAKWQEEMAEDELLALMHAAHPNVVRVEDAWMEMNPDSGRVRFVIVSELCSGGDLDEFVLGREEPLETQPSALHRICIQLARGLAHIHAKGMVHRDIKPPNVLLNSNDDCKIGDLGLGVIAEQPLLDRAGTGDYFAPEVEGGRPYTSQADVFSLGLLFLAISRRHVLDEDTDEPLLGMEVVEEDAILTPAQALEAGYPLQVLDPEFFHKDSPFSLIVRAMLDPDPARRWTAPQVLAALHGLDVATMMKPSLEVGLFGVPPELLSDDVEPLYPVCQDPDLLWDPPSSGCCALLWRWISNTWGFILLVLLIATFAFSVTVTFNDYVPDGAVTRYFRVRTDESAPFANCKAAGSIVNALQDPHCYEPVILVGAVISAVFGASIVMVILVWSLVLLMFARWPGGVSRVLFWVTEIVCGVLAWFFWTNAQIWWSFAFGVACVVRLVLVSKVYREIKYQSDLSLTLVRHVFAYLRIHAKGLLSALALVLFCELLLFWFGMLFFVGVSSWTRAITLIPYAWLLSVQRNIFHATSSSLVLDLLRGHAHSHPVRAALKSSYGNKMPSILILSVFTVMAPFWTALLSFSSATYTLAYNVAHCLSSDAVQDKEEKEMQLLKSIKGAPVPPPRGRSGRSTALRSTAKRSTVAASTLKMTVASTTADHELQQVSVVSDEEMEEEEEEESHVSFLTVCCGLVIGLWVVVLGGVARLLMLLSGVVVRFTRKYNISSMQYHNCTWVVSVYLSEKAHRRHVRRNGSDESELIHELMSNPLLLRANGWGSMLIASISAFLASWWVPGTGFFAFVVGYATARTCLEPLDGGYLIHVVALLENPNLLNARIFEAMHRAQNQALEHVMEEFREKSSPASVRGIITGVASERKSEEEEEEEQVNQL